MNNENQFFFGKKANNITSLLTFERTTVLLVLILALFAVNAFWFIPTKTELDANVLTLYSTFAADAKNQISGFIFQQRRAIENLAFAISANPRDAKEHISRTLREDPAIESIALLGVSGRELFREERTSLVTKDDLRQRSADPAFQHVRQEGTPYLSPVFVSETGEYLITMAFPLSLEEAAFQEPVSVVSADIRIRFMIEVVSQISVGQEGVIYVVDSSGFLIAHPDLSLVLKRINVRDRNIVKEALSGREASTFEQGNAYLNFAGEKVFALALPLEAGPGWGIVAEAPEQEVFAPHRRAILVAFLTFGVELVFIFILFIVALRLMVIMTDLRESKLALEEKTKELEESKMSLEIKVGARTKQLKELAESLEGQVGQRTKELKERLLELERFKRLTVGRELRMIELKGAIEKLKKGLQKNGGKKK